ncbi:MAG: PilZ domain-containing protein [Terracidiphilus sp.]
MENESGGKSANKAERRREARHKVDGSAILHLLTLGIKMPGRVLDLSLGGCALRTVDPFVLGIYRRVEVEFQIEGLPFRLAGVTQSIHDQRTLGIRFLNLSERKREQLLQLIEEMEEHLKAQAAANEPRVPPNESGPAV